MRAADDRHPYLMLANADAFARFEWTLGFALSNLPGRSAALPTEVFWSNTK
jgi:hypothetical protein